VKIFNCLYCKFECDLGYSQYDIFNYGDFHCDRCRVDYSTEETNKIHFISFSRGTKNISIFVERKTTAVYPENKIDNGIVFDYIMDITPDNAEETIERCLKLKCFI
jgi:hypothetical protein